MTKKQIIKKLKSNPLILETIDSKYFSNHNFMLKVLEHQPLFAIRFIDKKLLDNITFMEKASQVKFPQNLSLFAFASKRIKHNDKLILSFIKNNSQNLQYLSNKIRSDKNLALKLIKNDMYNLQFATDVIKSDKQVVLESIKKQSSQLRYASESLKKSKEFIIEVMEIDDSIDFNELDKELQNDKEIIKKYLSSVNWLNEPWEYEDYNGNIVAGKEYRFEQINNRKVVLDIVNKHPISILFAKKKFQLDEEIIKSIIGKNAWKDILDILKAWHPKHKNLFG